MLRHKNKYTRFLANGLMLIFIIIVLDQFLGSLLSHFYFKSKSGLSYYQTYSMDSTYADVIVLGSSRARRHYIPNIIEDKVKLTCFNTGFDGRLALNSCAIFYSIINRYSPKVILFDINPDELFVGKGGYDRLGSLLPYYNKKKEIRMIINLKSKLERIKLLSRTYPYNSTLTNIVTSNLLQENVYPLNGYLPLYGHLKDSTFLNLPRQINENLDTIKIRVLRSLASECKTKGIRLVFIQSPRYAQVYSNKSISTIYDIANQYGAEFWNYVNAPIFRKADYFSDPFHLNDYGANKFTNLVAEKLKNINGLKF